MVSGDVQAPTYLIINIKAVFQDKVFNKAPNVKEKRVIFHENYKQIIKMRIPIMPIVSHCKFTHVQLLITRHMAQ